MIDKLTSVLSRIFFVLAFVIFLIAITDGIMRMFGWTFAWVEYSPGRMFEFSAMLMIFVVVLLLRQIRERLKASR